MRLSRRPLRRSERVLGRWAAFFKHDVLVAQVSRYSGDLMNEIKAFLATKAPLPSIDEALIDGLEELLAMSLQCSSGGVKGVYH